MRILVTGNQGYIGTHVSQHLVSCGYDTIGLDSGFFKYCHLTAIKDEVRTFQKDIRDAEVQDFANIDTVVHLAALSNDPIGELDSELTFEINYIAAVRVAELAKAAGVSRFIFISTQSIYGISNSIDELDEVILDIIGRDSPLLAPLPIVDAGAQILPPPIPLATSASSADDEETDQSINQSSKHR